MSCTNASHEDDKRDELRWRSMRHRGFIQVPADETGPAETLDLRDCPLCGSTLAKVV